mmetsp:Transcript_36952/g.72667  ORF Transcript_36952/g.72667 Transcript_36952/m.72667 type:complete len:138 (-) Transcript_36952:199-612(-)
MCLRMESCGHSSLVDSLFLFLFFVCFLFCRLALLMSSVGMSTRVNGINVGKVEKKERRDSRKDLSPSGASAGGERMEQQQNGRCVWRREENRREEKNDDKGKAKTGRGEETRKGDAAPDSFFGECSLEGLNEQQSID